MAPRISNHFVRKRRRSGIHQLDSRHYPVPFPSSSSFMHQLRLLGRLLLTMNCISTVTGVARRGGYKDVSKSRYHNMFTSRAQPSSSFSAFATWPSTTIHHRKFELPSVAFSSTMSLIQSQSSALHMVNHNKSTNNRGGKQGRSSSSTSSSSSSSSSATKTKMKQSADKPKNTKKKKDANTGRLRLLQPLQPSNEILSRAQRQTYHEVKDDMKIANQRRRTQKRGAQTIDSLSQKLCAPLKQTVQTYRRELKYMHPFEKVVMELTIRARQKKDGLTLSTILEDIHEGRKEILQLSKDWIAKIKNAPSARESFEFTEEAKENIARVFIDLIEQPWSGLMELQKSLRNVPIVRLDCPAVVLVGAPNVGKFSIYVLMLLYE